MMTAERQDFTYLIGHGHFSESTEQSPLHNHALDRNIVANASLFTTLSSSRLRWLQ